MVMADEVDKANDMQEIILAMNIKANSRPLVIITTGKCLWCDEDVGSGMRWCDANCRDDWEKK